MKVTTEDVKTIKYEKRLGYLFALFLLALGGIANLFYLATTEKPDLNSLMLVNLLIVGLCVAIPYAMNYKYNRDIKLGSKIVKFGIVQKKEESVSYEAGSGNLYIPILGDLFPKAWSQQMKANKKYGFYIDDYKYDVSREIYDDVAEGEEVEMHYTAYSEMFLRFKVKNYREAGLQKKKTLES